MAIDSLSDLKRKLANALQEVPFENLDCFMVSKGLFGDINAWQKSIDVEVRYAVCKVVRVETYKDFGSRSLGDHVAIYVLGKDAAGGKEHYVLDPTQYQYAIPDSVKAQYGSRDLRDQAHKAVMAANGAALQGKLPITTPSPFKPPLIIAGDEESAISRWQDQLVQSNYGMGVFNTRLIKPENKWDINA